MREVVKEVAGYAFFFLDFFLFHTAMHGCLWFCGFFFLWACWFEEVVVLVSLPSTSINGNCPRIEQHLLPRII